ncbi:hypothetical protein F5Y17DRAFT_456321 [Xylariaceae sp. FL0594]|nr:hypothetical protein F5Y17DRAFT_456321 [Xylariaceae sp. FL0594]
MPYFRGIEIFIHASLEARQIPEYPHPDASSVSLPKSTTLPSIRDAYTGAKRSPAPSGSDAAPTASDELDPTRQKKLNPRISVYIPSLPGEQFWLRYLVSQSPAPSQVMFFKMTMNGRYISSWGINTDVRRTGSVVRALYKPGDLWSAAYDHDNPDFTGIETRYFHFMPGLEKKSIAEDGGVIEIQVFRCKGRKRIAPILDPYRNQERYGIASPSGGIVDNPEDATYYNYYLTDPKDAPYATFCFHYRSMKYLKQLNLVPQVDLSMSPPAKSPFRVQGGLSKGASRPGSPLKLEITHPQARQSRLNANTQNFPELGSIPYDEDERKTAEEANDSATDYYFHSPIALSPSSPSDVHSDDSTKAFVNEFETDGPYRPLPEVPFSQSRPQSASSMRSTCPSLTPSLRRYVDSDEFDNEDIRLSTAQPLLITSASMQAMELNSAGADETASISDYAVSSPSSSEASGSPKLPSPEGYIPTTGSVLERHLKQYDSPRPSPSPSTIPNVQPHRTGSPRSKNRQDQRMSALELTETEWLRHTPSPSKGDQDPVVEDGWSRVHRTQPTRSSLDGALGSLGLASQDASVSSSPRRNSFDTVDQSLGSSFF